MRIDHVGLAVGDTERSINFYRRLAGAKVVDTWQSDDLRLTFLDIGGLTVELVEHLGQKAPKRARGPIDHIAFRVPDMEKALAAAREAGAQDQLPEPKVVGEKTIMFVAGPDGERIEFVQKRS